MASSTLISQTFNHLVLPPKLPGKQDEDLHLVHKDLTSRVLHAVQRLRDIPNAASILESIEVCLKICSDCHRDDLLDKYSCIKAFQSLHRRNAAIFYIREQNAGLIIRPQSNSHDDENFVIFEAFEAASTSEAILAAKGALRRQFPGQAVKLPSSVFQRQNFQNALALFLEQASVEQLETHAAKSRKASVSVVESRDTTHPSIITEFLATLLEENGSRINPPILIKRVKDDVCWDDSKLPWRRSPFWLVLRTSVQRLLYLSEGEGSGRAYYKFLICLVLADLLDDSLHSVSPEFCNILKAKLCRRLAKLEIEKKNSDKKTQEVNSQLLETVGRLCRDSIKRANTQIEKAWQSFKNRCIRQIPSLRSNAQEEDLYLTLPNSAAHLQGILNQPFPKNNYWKPQFDSEASHFLRDQTNQDYDSFAALVQSCTNPKITDENILNTSNLLNQTDLAQCKFLAQTIDEYIAPAIHLLKDTPDLISVSLLNIFELWVEMDKLAVDSYPLLKDYHPVFYPELLDVLILSRKKDIRRLRGIQRYLSYRCIRCQMNKMNIFSDPQPNCFADRFVRAADSTEFGEKFYQTFGYLPKLKARIEQTARLAKVQKEEELNRVNKKYSELTEKIQASHCYCTVEADGTRNVRGCDHCFYIRSRRRLGITVYEDLLPANSIENDARSHAVVFEIGIPTPYSIYRDATWRMISGLNMQVGKSSSDIPEVLIREHSGLTRFSNGVTSSLTLASKSKSFLGTHYKSKQLPASARRVLLPFALKLAYYDESSKKWPTHIPSALSLAHHCSIKLHRNSPFSDLYSSPAFAADANGPSSYEIVASQTKCPQELTRQEFMAHQTLIAGKFRRWISILTELGSNNINFSLEETMLLFNFLALQVGPQQDDKIGTVHTILADHEFCLRLLERIDERLDIIAPNWRESNYMEILVTLALRIHEFGPKETTSNANKLLQKIRRVTLGWISRLRSETRKVNTAKEFELTAHFAFTAALLCRRTFEVYTYQKEEMDSSAFQSFVESTLAIQQNLVVGLEKNSITDRNRVIRDINLAFKLRFRLTHLALQYSANLELAITTIWQDFADKPRQYSSWEIVKWEDQWWIASRVKATDCTNSQMVHYHLLHGYLLVDGKGLGSLPADMRDHVAVRTLFGNQRLTAVPSNMPGMVYMLGNYESHEIHLGYRDNNVVIRARTAQSILEFIEPAIFGYESSLDVPHSLVDDFVHWFDASRGLLEFRKKPQIWEKNHPRNWILDFFTRKAYRRQVTLVNPDCEISRAIANIFNHFELPRMLRVSRGKNGRLEVELKRMNLSFFVNRRNLLECRQLKAEIDPNQDAGTFYGLRSMLVLRDRADPTKRSIIVPIGQIEYVRDGPHVALFVENRGDYARYMINDVLARLDCPPEPRLLYSKAQFHAFTSFFLPDPLTERTGTEEALSCLQAGYCQPWTPLSKPLLDLLESVSSLTVCRSYYPSDKKKLQRAGWNPKLTVTIQHDAYLSVIDHIVSKSQRLRQFEAQHSEEPFARNLHVEHLLERALWRRSLYERTGSFQLPHCDSTEECYVSRDNSPAVSKQNRLKEILSLLKNQPSKFRTSSNLISMLEQWRSIGGFTQKTLSFQLSYFLEMDMPQEWGSLVRDCKDSSPEDIYRLMFELGLIAYGDEPNMEALRTVTAFFFCKDLKELQQPQCGPFIDFKVDEAPQFHELESVVESSKLASARVISRTKSGKPRPDKVSEQEQFQDECARLVEELIKQWPCSEPTVNNFQSKKLVLPHALKAIMPEWSRLYNNLSLSKFLQDAQRILNTCYIRRNKFEERSGLVSINYWQVNSKRGRIVPLLDLDLLRKSVNEFEQFVSQNVVASVTARSQSPTETSSSTRGAASIPKSSAHGTETDELVGVVNDISLSDGTSSTLNVLSVPKASSIRPEIEQLAVIVHKLSLSDCATRREYAKDLEQSIQALKIVEMRPKKSKLVPATDIACMILRIQLAVKKMFEKISAALAAGDENFEWLKMGNLWPCVTTRTILENLGSSAKGNTSSSMHDALLAYACTIAKLQRLLRIQEATRNGNATQIQQELENDSHVNWKPKDYPDWLLMEIDANITIRKDQVNVALETISPTSNSNSVLQMSMGRGKTSVIMPMVAAVLANGNRLTRLFVPKALLFQTAQVLQSRIGGLLAREVTHIPFTRRTVTSPGIIQEYHDLHKSTLQKFGIILESPDHALSFKLSGLQFVSDSKISEASKMVNVQNWMGDVCRDVIDESDLALSVKTQLIYPSGTQSTVDGQSNRWNTIQDILSIVKLHLPALAQKHAGFVELVNKEDRAFPICHILRYEAEEDLRCRIAEEILFGMTERLPLRGYTEENHEKIRSFILEEQVLQSTFEHVLELFKDNDAVKKNLFLIRGLLTHRILLSCLKKRWNVQYGLHPRRDPIAVPFHAKGIPSDESEWGHPDVAITFTCLAFYYSGLNFDQVRQSLKAVLGSDDPSAEYDRLISSAATLPTSLQHWNIINLDDTGQVQEICNHLRFSVPVINYFLNKFVFPLYAKQFSIKLQVSGWDIPLWQGVNSIEARREKATVAPSARVHSSGLTTGFSGTNDNKRLLPLTIEQQDLPSLSHTNAEVLAGLLQYRNREYIEATDKSGQRLSELELLRLLGRQEIRILIDSGAYILEMDNESLVTNWLKVAPAAKAAIFFSSDSRAWVRYQNEKTVPLLATPFVEDLSDCLVYLDEAHTRGTDLKFPPTAKGALTLCLNQTKDHTVQAAMRLRQLETSQSVVFISPPEVHRSILDVCNKSPDDILDSSHVISWLLEQTCANIKDLQPLYFAQKEDFNNRMRAATKYNKFLEKDKIRKKFLKALQKSEQMTLEQLYKPKGDAQLIKHMSDYVFEEVEVRHEAQVNESSFCNSALEEVEQQREVSHEVEEERQKQNRTDFKAHNFKGLQPSIRKFASSGILESDEGYKKASEAFEMARTRAKYRISPTCLLRNLYVSNEFLRTIKYSEKHSGDQFMRSKILSIPGDQFIRPVNWILLNRTTHTAIVIIPEEAEILIDVIRKSQAPMMHLVTYAAPVTRSMNCFNDLKYYSLPTLPRTWKPQSWLPIELGLLSGRLYFTYGELYDILSHLGFAEKHIPGDRQGESHQLQQTLLFLREWLAIRRNGQDILHTPMGYICQGLKLRSDHPFFWEPSTAQKELIDIHNPTGNTSPSQEPPEPDDYESAEEEHGSIVGEDNLA